MGLGAPKPPPAPDPIDPGESALKYVEGMANPELHAKIIGTETTYRPQYANLNLQDAYNYAFGMGDQAGLVDIAGRAGQEYEGYRSDIATRQREADIADVEMLGGRATEALRASDPYTQELIDNQRELANDVYARSRGVTPQQKRMAEQQARESFAARGRSLDNASIAAEILGREEFQRQNRMEAAQMGQGTLGMYQATAADPFQAILGRPAQSTAYGANLGRQGAGMLGQSTSQMINPDAGVNLALQQQANQANYNSNVYGAQASSRGSMLGGLFGGIGSIIGGF